MQVWGSGANFNGFHMLASLSTAPTSVMEVNQTFHDVWPSPGLVHCIYTVFQTVTFTANLSLSLTVKEF